MSLRIAALGLLAQHPGSGYDLLKRFQASMANVWPATQSQLYGELNKLAGAGLIEVTAVGARGRKEYAVTAAGRSELLRWITDPAGDPPMRRPDLLRVFLLGEIPGADARRYVASFAERAESDLARFEALRDAIDWSGDDEYFFGRAALEYGIRNAVMEADWARWLLEAMDRRAK
ncbi:PadR family transcriptional regulator [Mycolicibacterium palauense]|uniref:PadR family transcriptional regulator n=1 Tax=Mycolicibacterium palauense TaxID=2034511 RepID=UPI000BFF02F6|nr:PadR family transcriptional regulator [Mycolicibacterium palauense]